MRDVVDGAAKTWCMLQRPRLISKDKGCRLVVVSPVPLEDRGCMPVTLCKGWSSKRRWKFAV